MTTNFALTEDTALDLPPELNQAVAATGGGKITIVAGAGCSLEEPTSIPLSGDWAKESHARLLADGYLVDGECTDPQDLSCVADAVAARHGGSQRHLVNQLISQYPSLKTPTPNKGHLLAAAMLSEGAIASIVTLNFDLAFSYAIGQLGVEKEVAIIDGPNCFGDQSIVNLYYLHGNVYSNPEDWVLRSQVIESGWNNTWQPVITAKVLATPVIVFAGLGTPATVLITTTKLIRAAIQGSNGTYNIYQVDPGPSANSPYFKELQLPETHFINAGWCQFMEYLSTRLLEEQVFKLRTTTEQMRIRESIAQESLQPLLDRILNIGLIGFGSVRAMWLLHNKSFLKHIAQNDEYISDLLLGIAMIARVTNTTPVMSEDGVVEFQRGKSIKAVCIFASGKGTKSRNVVEAEIQTRRRRLGGRSMAPNSAILAGTRDGLGPQVPVPKDIVTGDSQENIMLPSLDFHFHHLENLRANPTDCTMVTAL
ncbi:MAG: hypothetical protein SGI97_00155 [candidate division Zixibacteria bacterium]|nr:hypothetical protein [candidate division Zixibacteria bacterium]